MKTEAENYYLVQANYGEWDTNLYTPENFELFCAHGNQIFNQITIMPNTGFVWSSGTGFYGDVNVTTIFNNPNAILNLSVWQSYEALKQFVFNGTHLEVMKHRDIWLKRLPRLVSVLWWVKVGELPTISQAKEKLDLINANGAIPEAFDFSSPFNFMGQRI